MGLIIFGIVVAAAGWIFLLFGVGVDVSGGLTRSVVNLHSLSIASNVIYLGYVMTVVGTILELPERLWSKARELKPPVPEFATPKESFDPNNPIFDPFSDLPPGARVERHFRRRVAFLQDGSVFGETDQGPARFKSFKDWQRAIGK